MPVNGYPEVSTTGLPDNSLKDKHPEQKQQLKYHCFLWKLLVKPGVIPVF